MSFKLGHVSIPKRRIFLSLFLFCAHDRESSNGLFDWLKQIFSQSKSPLELSQFSRLMAFVKDANGISFKNRLKGHINWRKVRNFIII
jgi:hypothetical protein